MTVVEDKINRHIGFNLVSFEVQRLIKDHPLSKKLFELFFINNINS